jgi:hypothetical protein
MEVWQLGVSLALAFMSQACEVSRSQQQEPAPIAAPAPSPHAQAQEAPKLELPKLSGGGSTIRRVDGRVAVPPRSSDSPTPAVNLISYAFGTRPTPLVTEPARILVSPADNPLRSPYIEQNVQVDRLVLHPDRHDWEPALLSRGIKIVDRSSFDLIERELFLQEASATEADVSRILKGQTSNVDGSQSTLGERLAFDAPIVGRDRYPINRPFFWHRLGEKYFPLLSGRDAAGQSRLELGRVLPAKWILELGEIEYDSTDLLEECNQPTAERIPYVPEVTATVAPPLLREGVWRVTEGDPFHLVQEDGAVYFDPETKSLWTLSHAWIGPQVARAEFLKRPTTGKQVLCQECGRIVSEKSLKIPVPPESIPTTWQCRTCQGVHDVDYFEGYRDASLTPESSQATIYWRWLDFTAGVYPVLQPGNRPPDAIAAYSFSGPAWSTDRLMAQCTPSALLGPGGTSWCVIGEDGSALLLSSGEIAKLRNALALEAATETVVVVPRVDREGKQVFSLASSPYSSVRVGVPIAFGAVKVRLVRIQDASVVMSGSLALSFRNLVRAQQAIHVTADGPDLSGWPSVDIQQAQLRDAIQERLALMLAP